MRLRAGATRALSLGFPRVLDPSRRRRANGSSRTARRRWLPTVPARIHRAPRTGAPFRRHGGRRHVRIECRCGSSAVEMFPELTRYARPNRLPRSLERLAVRHSRSPSHRASPGSVRIGPWLSVVRRGRLPTGRGRAGTRVATRTIVAGGAARGRCPARARCPPDRSGRRPSPGHGSDEQRQCRPHEL